jgi:hypothetical protein
MNVICRRSTFLKDYYLSRVANCYSLIVVCRALVSVFLFLGFSCHVEAPKESEKCFEEVTSSKGAIKKQTGCEKISNKPQNYKTISVQMAPKLIAENTHKPENAPSSAPASIVCPLGTVVVGGEPPTAYELYCTKIEADGTTLRHGPYKAWLPPSKIRLNSTLEKVGQYKDGQRDGLWQTYFTDGTLASEGTFTKGNMNGIWTSYMQGKISCDADLKNGNGKIFNYFSESMVLEGTIHENKIGNQWIRYNIKYIYDDSYKKNLKSASRNLICFFIDN